MGYTTEFDGEFQLNQALSVAHAEYLHAFSDTRRMKRNTIVAANFSDPKRQAVCLPIGVDGEFFVGFEENYGQTKDASVISYNEPPQTQPSLWCQWVPNESKTAIIWNEGEKFYDYIEWLQYLIRNFLTPWGYILNGSVSFQGEDVNDSGIITVTDNVVTVIINENQDAD